MNISVVAPFLFAPNLLCLHFNGHNFNLLFSKGMITSLYPTPKTAQDLYRIDLKEALITIEVEENVSIPEDYLLIKEDREQCWILHWKNFFLLKDLSEMAFLDEEQWKRIIQYGKVLDQLDRVKYFVSKMKILSNASYLQTIEQQIHQQYAPKQRSLEREILLLKEKDLAEESQEHTLLQQHEAQLEQIQVQINNQINTYVNEHLHLTPKYWNEILNLIHQQEISSYSIEDFYLY